MNINLGIDINSLLIFFILNSIKIFYEKHGVNTLPNSWKITEVTRRLLEETVILSFRYIVTVLKL